MGIDKVPPPKPFKHDTFTFESGEVRFIWPTDLTVDDYGDLTQWVALVLRKVGRLVNKKGADDG